MYKIIVLVLMHIVADFVLQDNNLDFLSISRKLRLFAHVGLYTLIFIAMCPLLLGFTFLEGLVFSLINGATHLLIDIVTTRMRIRFWRNSEPAFVATVSVDHLLHILILFVTLLYMYPEVWEIPLF